MRVMLPVRATFTHDVTAANDLDALNLLAAYYLAPKHSFENILAISERLVFYNFLLKIFYYGTQETQSA